MTKVMVFGTFDIIHPGHIYFLKESKKYGDELIIVVARDTNVMILKGHESKFSEAKRVEKIKKLGLGNIVMLGDKKDYFKVIEKNDPDIICLGYDQGTHQVEKKFPKIKFIKIEPYKEHIYKSSKLK